MNPTSRIAVATCDAASSGRPSQRASSVRLACTGPMNWTSAARSASDASGRSRSAASGNRPRDIASRPESSCSRIALIPSGPMSVARCRASSLASQRPSRYWYSAIPHRRWVPKNRIRPSRSVVWTPTHAASTASSSRPATSRTKTRLACARPMSSTLPTSSAMSSATRRSSMPSSVSPSVPRPIPRVLRAWPSTSRAPTARAAVRASLAQVLDSSNLAPSIRIWARPAIARARATDGGSAGVRRTAVRYASLATSPCPAIQAQRPSRSLRRLARAGSAVSSTSRIAVWIKATARAASWKRATPPALARSSTRSCPTRVSASGTCPHSSSTRSYWARASGNA